MTPASGFSRPDVAEPILQSLVDPPWLDDEHRLTGLSGRIRPTAVFASYWHLACERQRIFYRRLLGRSAPWTADPILATHRFTNTYRASDRVSQYLINTVIPGSDLSADDIFFRVMLFKTFNRVTTWQLLEGALGPLHWPDIRLEVCDAVLTRAVKLGSRIYSAAYIMPPPRLGHDLKHRNHLELLRLMMTDHLPDQLAEAVSLEAAYTLLLAYPSVGPFLAYQYAIDLNYSRLLAFGESDFVVPGPGAADGIRKCFVDNNGLSDAELIHLTAEIAIACLDRLELTLPSLWGRPLQLIDYQNLYCEVGKYARKAYPGILGTSARSRIKQRFRPISTPITARYPDKWGLPSAAIVVDGVPVPYGQASLVARS